MIVVTKPEAQAVAEDRPGDGPGRGRQEGEVAEPDQRTDAEHQERPRHYQADDGQRFAERDQEHHAAGPVRVGGDPVEQDFHRRARRAGSAGQVAQHAPGGGHGLLQLGVAVCV